MPSPSTIRWVDRSQPQTLMMATVVLYINAVLSILSGGFFLLLIIGQVAAGLGIANEKKWGYWLGVATTAFFVALMVLFLSFGAIINLIFYIALLGLLLHPMSRSYYRTWFR